MALFTIKKGMKIFLRYKGIQKGSDAKSYLRKGFLIQNMRKRANIYSYMRKPLVIYDFAPDPF